MSVDDEFIFDKEFVDVFQEDVGPPLSLAEETEEERIVTVDADAFFDSAKSKILSSAARNRSASSTDEADAPATKKAKMSDAVHDAVVLDSCSLSKIGLR